MNNYKIQVTQYIFYYDNIILGQGTFGSVFQGIYRCPQYNNEIVCAIKVISQKTTRNGDEINKYYQNEIDICNKIKDCCKQFNNKDKELNIVEVYEVITINDLTYIVMEYCDHTLDTYKFMTIINSFDMVQAIEFTEQLLNGIAFLHKHDIIHRDIKPDNIFIVENKQTNKITLKIGDFNISKHGDNLPSTVGTINYMAPETLPSLFEKDTQQNKHTKKSDIWSIGLVIHEMITGSQIFIGNNTKKIIQDINKFGSYYNKWDRAFSFNPDKMPPKISPETRNFLSYYLPWQKISYSKIALLIDKLLKSDPNIRLNAEAALIECQQIKNDQELKANSYIQLDREISNFYQKISKIEELKKVYNTNTIEEEINQSSDLSDYNTSKQSLIYNDINRSQENYDEILKQLNYHKVINQIQKEYINVIEQEKEQLVLQVTQLLQVIDNTKIYFQQLFPQQIQIQQNQIKQEFQFNVQNPQNLQMSNQQQIEQALQVLQQQFENLKQQQFHQQNIDIQNLELFKVKINDPVKYILEKHESQYCDTLFLPHIQNINKSNDRKSPIKVYMKPQGDNPKKKQQFEETFIMFAKLFQNQQQNLNKFVNIIPIEEIYIDNLQNANIFIDETSLRSMLQNMNYFAIRFKNEDKNFEDFIRQLKNRDLKHNEDATIKTKIQIMYQIASQIQYLHSQGLVHGKLNVKNIAFNTAEQQFKLCFYSVLEAANSKMSKQDMIYFEQSYMSPQQLQGEMSCFKDDIWSLGVIFHYVFAFNPLFQYNCQMKQMIIKYDSNYFKLWESCRRYREDVQNPQKYPQNIQKASEILQKIPNKQTAEFINRMLSNNPANRPDIKEIVLQLKQTLSNFS